MALTFIRKMQAKLLRGHGAIDKVLASHAAGWGLIPAATICFNPRWNQAVETIEPA